MIYEFEEFVLDTRRCELWSGRAVQHIEPQVYAVLCYLIENRDRLIRKEELLDRVWGHRFVSPATLNSRIKALRQALGDDGSAQRLIRTARGLGFRFVGEVAVRDEDVTAASAGGDNEQPASLEPLRATTTLAPMDGATADRESLPTLPEQRIRFCRGHDGARIAYAVSGRGPILLKTANWLTHLEHDWNSPVWRHWLSELSRDGTLVRYDARGSGLSDREVDDLSFESWVRDLEVVIDEIGVEKVPLLGVSQGCAVAVAFAVRHPERVSRLVLYGGFPLGRMRRARTPHEMAQAEMMIRVMPLGWGQDNPAFRQFFATMFLPEGTPEQMAWFSELQRVSATPETAVRLLSESGEIDVCELATRVTAPTLVLHANGDAVIPFEQGRLLAGLIPGARLVPLEGRNHVLLASEPAWPRFLEEVRAFLTEDEIAVDAPLLRHTI
jgi:pimeloyl-ACP methyl ester carboxylesterase/DNA-binding winged helix-turn-helix (wHTH) protein